MNSWVSAWQYAINLPDATPQWIVAIFVLVILYVGVIVPSSLVMAFLERKLSADLQARVGPNRVGPAGFFQPLTDVLKLLQKQKETRAHSSSSEALWLNVYAMALYSTIAVLPFGSLSLLVDTDMSVFIPFWAVLVLTVGTMMLGLSQHTVPAGLGGIRVAFQSLAGAFPALVAILSAGIPAGGFRWSFFAEAQGASPFSWSVFTGPFGWISLIVFLLSGMIILSIPPVEGGLASSEIYGGVGSSLSGRKLSLFRLTRFYGFFLWCTIATVLFLGGWTLPAWLMELLTDSNSLRTIIALELIYLLIKVFVLMLIITLLAQVTPRVRVDQTTDLTWKVLSPFALIALTGTAIWTAWRG